jgi:hypothetical protein
VTDLRASQLALEVWLSNPPSVRASQLALEAWLSGLASNVIVSQAALEAWVRQGTFFVTSQAVLEAWVSTEQIKPKSPRLPLSAQVV